VTSSSHSAAASALGYWYQTQWALYDLLRRGHAMPDSSLTLELLDDVAWQQHGQPQELLQLKLISAQVGGLGNMSVDLWKTILVWLEGPAPSDPLGPQLTLVSTGLAAAGSAAAMLRADPAERNEPAAADALAVAARASTAQETAKARDALLSLDPSELLTFVGKIIVADRAQPIQDNDELVRQELMWVTPPGQEDLFLGLVWRWWSRVALDLLQRRRSSVSVAEARNEIADIRNTFGDDNLPTLVELADIVEDDLLELHGDRPFVHQMRWVDTGSVHLRKAVIDYYRAVTQTTEWLDRDLIGRHELQRFEDRLRDEWERAFADMLEDLPANADEVQKKQLGKTLLRQLRDSTAVMIRSRYSESFYARGKRHELADSGHIGWHPEFEQMLGKLLSASGAE